MGWGVIEGGNCDWSTSGVETTKACCFCMLGTIAECFPVYRFRLISIFIGEEGEKNHLSRNRPMDAIDRIMTIDVIVFHLSHWQRRFMWACMQSAELT